MKKTAFLFLLLACFVQDTYSHDPWVAAYASYSFLKNPNLRMGFDMNVQLGGDLELQFVPFNFSLIQESNNKKVFVASNILTLLPAAAPILIIKDSELSFILIIPFLISNSNISYSVIPGRMKLNLRQNTDYFFFIRYQRYIWKPAWVWNLTTTKRVLRLLCACHGIRDIPGWIKQCSPSSLQG